MTFRNVVTVDDDPEATVEDPEMVVVEELRRTGALMPNWSTRLFVSRVKIRFAMSTATAVTPLRDVALTECVAHVDVPLWPQTLSINVMPAGNLTTRLFPASATAQTNLNNNNSR